MWRPPSNSAPTPSHAAFHLLGEVGFDDCLALQKRLVFEAGERRERQIVVLFVEHPQIVTVGRTGSRADIRLTPEELESRRLDVRWLGRGGGCIVHSPGQLAVYPIVPLDNFGWTVGEHLRRLQLGLLQALTDLGVSAQSRPGRFGVWGRTGQLAACGVAVQQGVAWQGAFVNVNPSSRAVGFVETTPRGRSAAREPNAAAAAFEKPEMSSLLAERGRPVKMTRVRQTLLESMCAAWDCDQHHVFTGHPLLTSLLAKSRESTARAS